MTTYIWNSLGQLQSASVQSGSGPVLRTLSYSYNELGQVLSVKLWFPSAGQSEAQAFLTSFAYDDNGNRQRLTDPTGATATYGYDPNNNLTSLLWPAFQGIARSLSWGYDRNDFLSGTTWATQPSVAETYANDQLGRRVQRTDPRGAVFTYGLAMTPGASDPLPLLATTNWPAPTTGAATAQAATTYDALGRVTGSVDRGGISAALAYTTQADSVTSTQQTVVTIELTPATGGPGTVTKQTYDALGRLVKVVDEASRVWTWAYTVETDARTQQKVLVTTLTDPTGRTSAVATDSLDRIAFRRDSGGGLTRLTQYAYDAIGRPMAVIQTQGATSHATAYVYGYDTASGRVTTSIGRPGGNGGTTVLYFNGRGELKRQIDPFGQPASFSYAPWGGLATSVDGQGHRFSYAFDAAGRLQSRRCPTGLRWCRRSTPTATGR